MTPNATAATPISRQPLLAQDIVDVAALRRNQKHAVDRLETLHRHRDRQHELVVVVDALGFAGIAHQRAVHFGIDAAVVAGFEIGREVGERSDARDAVVETFDRTLDPAPQIERRQFLRFDHVAREKIARVDDEMAVAGVDARAQSRRLHQLAEQRLGLGVVDGQRLVDRGVFGERTRHRQRFHADAGHAFVDEAARAATVCRERP